MVSLTHRHRFARVLSLVTSLTGIAEASGVLPLWNALLERIVKTLAQAIVDGIGNAVLVQDVHWVVILQNAAVAGPGSFVLAGTTPLPSSTRRRSGSSTRFTPPSPPSRSTRTRRCPPNSRRSPRGHLSHSARSSQPCDPQ